MKKTYLKQLFTALLLLCSAIVTASDFEADGIYYNITDATNLTVEVAFKNRIRDGYSGAVTIPASVTYNETTYSVTSIGTRAFFRCSGLTNITIPNSVTSIGYGAFNGCTGITSITIPNSVTSIGESAFNGCTGITAVHISDLAAWCKIDFRDSYSNPLYYAHNLYLNGELVTDLVIPNGVTEIKEYAFNGCSGLTNITIPNSVTSIGESAFNGCTGITSITIPNGVTSIRGDAFAGCTALRELHIEDGDSTLSLSYNSIGIGLFYDCPLETLYLGRNLSYNTSYSCGYSPFYKVTTLKNVTIGNSVTIIKEYIFDCCRGITSIEIPSSVTTIGKYAFHYNGLHEVHIPAGVTSIGYNAFTCGNLQKITMDRDNEVYNIPDNSNIIMKGDSVIFGWQGAVIPEYATCIDNGAFEEASITSITIPAGVTSIGDCAFQACVYLDGIYCLSATPATAYYSTFYPLYENATLYVPIGASAAYRAADYWKNFTNIVEMDFTGIEDIEADGDNALHGAKDAYYDLNGRRVSEPAKGVYIRNGKKVYVE